MILKRRLLAATTTDVVTRLANYLLELPVRVENREMSVHLPLTKKDIASLLDTTPE